MKCFRLLIGILPFKVNLKGEIPIKNLKHFISLDVRRVDYQLLIENFEIIGAIPQLSTKNKSKKTS